MTSKTKTLEVRWHGRGGQGAKSASAILAEVLFEEGKHVQAFPEYGAERQGAPMKAYNRVSDSPIRCRCSVQNPNLVVVVDPTMVQSANPSEGCTKDAVYLVNTPEDAKELRSQMKLSDEAKVIAVDATKITLEELGQNRPNAPLLGALSHVFTDVPVETFADYFTKKMKQLPEKVLEANRRAIFRGREEAVLA
jgi:pyruvate ferredoxin oxidoreductase gamma subunit